MLSDLTRPLLILAAFPDNLVLGANIASAGLAWPNDLWVPMAGFTSPKTAISAYYNWSPRPVIPTAQHLPIFDIPFDFIPMIWGCTDDDVSSFKTALSSHFNDVRLTSRNGILAFNEPDLAAQANCSPERAEAVWKSTLEPLKAEGYRLGSPAVTGVPSGKVWMEAWLEACEGGCNPDFVAVHWYGSDARDFIKHVQDYYWTFGRFIWVTEYAVMDFTMIDSGLAPQATLDQIQVFLDVTRTYMEGVDWVEKYSFFGTLYDMQGVNPLNSLFDESGRDQRTGALSALGVQYARSNRSVSLDTEASDSGAYALRWGGGAVRVAFGLGLAGLVLLL